MSAVHPFEELLQALDAAGLWREVSNDEKRAITRALRSGRDVAWRAGGAWRADGEDLADGDVEVWLRGMAQALNGCGIDLDVVTGPGPFDEGSTGYTVTINGNPLILYTVDPAEPGLPTATADPWMDCTVEPAAEVNRLLEAGGSDRRLALFWPGGNDGFSVLGPESVLRRTFCSAAAAEGSWDPLIP